MHREKKGSCETEREGEKKLPREGSTDRENKATHECVREKEMRSNDVKE